MIYKYFNRLQNLRARELNVRGTRIYTPSTIDPNGATLLKDFVELLNEIDVENGFRPSEYKEYFDEMRKADPEFYHKLITEYYVVHPEMHLVADSVMINL